MTTLNFGNVQGLTPDEQHQLNELADVYQYHQPRNDVKNKYYEGHVTLNDVNLGIAIPNGLRNLEVGCNWGQKAVDALASRSMFDGFVGSGEAADAATRLVSGNRLLAEYGKACRDELKYGCVFATLSADQDLGCRIRFHSPATAAALWSGEKGRIDCGLAIIDTVPDEKYEGTWKPHIVNLYTDNAVLVLTCMQGIWYPDGTGNCPRRDTGRTDLRGTGHHAAFQESSYAQRGGYGGRSHQDRVGTKGVRQHGHISRDDWLRPGGHPAHQGAGTAGARAAVAC